MKSKRFKIALLSRENLATFIQGRCEISGLPEGFSVGNMDYSFRDDALAIQVYHESFPEVLPGCQAQVVLLHIREWCRHCGSSVSG